MTGQVPHCYRAVDMTLQPDARCPRCGGALATLAKPCSNCGLGFLPREQIHDLCQRPIGEHGLLCPPDAKKTPILCPLCGAKRHWKDARLSRLQCAWRQWAIASGQLARDAEPSAPLPSERDPEALAAFNKWLDANPNLEAGSVPAERILRQRKREAALAQEK